MVKVQIRKQGGAAIMTIPADLMKVMSLDIGADLTLEMADGALIVRPVKPPSRRRRYSLAELTEGVTQRSIAKLNQDTAWFREGKRRGREVA